MRLDLLAKFMFLQRLYFLHYLAKLCYKSKLQVVFVVAGSFIDCILCANYEF